MPGHTLRERLRDGRGLLQGEPRFPGLGGFGGSALGTGFGGTAVGPGVTTTTSAPADGPLGFDPGLPTTGPVTTTTPVEGPSGAFSGAGGGGGFFDETGAVRELPGGREGGFDFRATPGFNFRLQLNQQALENAAAARGGLLSGNTLKDLSRFSQGLASEEFTNVFNMLGALRSGQPSQTISSAASATGANVGNLLGNIGQAQAQGIQGQSQAFQQGLQNVGTGIFSLFGPGGFFGGGGGSSFGSGTGSAFGGFG